MTQDIETHTPTNLENLNTALAETMLVNGCDPAILTKQTELLDRLFSAMIEQRVIRSIDREKWDSESARSWLKLALQCQKQCNETVKSRAAMDYMQSLIDQHNRPHPTKIVKRTEGS